MPPHNTRPRSKSRATKDTSMQIEEQRTVSIVNEYGLGLEVILTLEGDTLLGRVEIDGVPYHVYFSQPQIRSLLAGNICLIMILTMRLDRHLTVSIYSFHLTAINDHEYTASETERTGHAKNRYWHLICTVERHSAKPKPTTQRSLHWLKFFSELLLQLRETR